MLTENHISTGPAGKVSINPETMNEIENFSREAKPTERNLDLSVACGLSVVETIKLLFNLSRAGN